MYEQLDDTDLHTYQCEVCDKQEELTEQQAFDQGWDYPPFIGAWTVVGPRTCGSCPIDKTVWWELAINHAMPEDLNNQQISTIERIIHEKDYNDAN